jgi:hypothetical protein
MKLKLFIATTAAFAIAVSAFAKSPETANWAAAKHLANEFKDVKNVTWSKQANLSEASFEWNGQKLHAFYNESGDQVALSREISEDRLPLRAIEAIRAKYSDYKAVEAIEFNSTETGLSYYVSMLKDNRKVILNVTPEGSVSVFK